MPFLEYFDVPVNIHLYIEVSVFFLPHAVHQCLSLVCFVIFRSCTNKAQPFIQVYIECSVLTISSPPHVPNATMLYTTLHVLMHVVYMVFILVDFVLQSFIHLRPRFCLLPPTPTGSLHPNGLVLGINR